MKFAATIARQGDLRIIVIPKRLRENIKDHVGKQVKITIEEL